MILTTIDGEENKLKMIFLQQDNKDKINNDKKKISIK